MIISHSAADTMAYGRQLAATLRAGDVVALTGDLGAGKTCLVKGIAAALGVGQAVTSPTFTLVHEYRGGRLPLFHIDLYRVESAQAAWDIGLEDYLAGNGVTVIEWAERVAPLLPARTRWLRLTVADETTRHIEEL